MKRVLLLLIFLGFGIANLSAAPTTFVVDNQSSQDLGTVTVSGLSSSTTLDVAASTSYNLNLSFSVVSVIINGQTVTAPNSAVILSPGGYTIKVQWQTNYIEIVDWQQSNSPSM